ncbi:MAG: hypothetical protein M1817_000075 [Caeruleum heppii]|nr:MAG: hypothetical protein M1817_000075 [Caeruleum heppii]
MDLLRKWLASFIISEFAIATGQTEQQPDKPWTGSLSRKEESWHLATDNASLTSRARHVQIHKFLSFDDPIEALISDGQNKARARLTPQAAQAFIASHHGKRVTEDTLGGIVVLRGLEVIFQNTEGAYESLTLLIKDCVYRGCGGTAALVGSLPLAGHPRIIAVQDELRSDHEKNAAPFRSQSTHAIPEIDSIRSQASDDSEVGGDPPSLTNATQSQPATQLPKAPKAEAPRLPIDNGHNLANAIARIPPELRLVPIHQDGRSGESASAISSAAHGTVREKRQSREDTSPVVSSPGVLSKSVSKVNLQPSCRTQTPPLNVFNDTSGGGIERSNDGLDGTTDDPWEGMAHIRRRDVIIPKDQEDLLVRSECWIPPEPGGRMPEMNVPLTMLKTFSAKLDNRGKLQETADEVVDEPTRTEHATNDESDKHPISTSPSATDSNNHSDEAFSWGSSPMHNQLPPDSDPEPSAGGGSSVHGKVGASSQSHRRFSDEEPSSSKVKRRRLEMDGNARTEAERQDCHVFRHQVSSEPSSDPVQAEAEWSYNERMPGVRAGGAAPEPQFDEICTESDSSATEEELLEQDYSQKRYEGKEHHDLALQHDANPEATDERDDGENIGSTGSQSELEACVPEALGDLHDFDGLETEPEEDGEDPFTTQDNIKATMHVKRTPYSANRTSKDKCDSNKVDGGPQQARRYPESRSFDNQIDSENERARSSNTIIPSTFQNDSLTGRKSEKNRKPGGGSRIFDMLPENDNISESEVAHQVDHQLQTEMQSQSSPRRGDSPLKDNLSQDQQTRQPKDATLGAEAITTAMELPESAEGKRKASRITGSPDLVIKKTKLFHPPPSFKINQQDRSHRRASEMRRQQRREFMQAQKAQRALPEKPTLLHKPITPISVTPTARVSNARFRAGSEIEAEVTPQHPRQSASQIPTPRRSNPEAGPENVYRRYVDAYPDYPGSLPAFVKTCAYVEHLVEEKRMEHKSLWDDFVFRFVTEYSGLASEGGVAYGNRLPYEQYYRDFVDEPTHTKGVLKPQMLLDVMRLDPASAGEIRYQAIPKMKELGFGPFIGIDGRIGEWSKEFSAKPMLDGLEATPPPSSPPARSQASVQLPRQSLPVAVGRTTIDLTSDAESPSSEGVATVALSLEGQSSPTREAPSAAIGRPLARNGLDRLEQRDMVTLSTPRKTHQAGELGRTVSTEPRSRSNLGRQVGSSPHIPKLDRSERGAIPGSRIEASPLTSAVTGEMKRIRERQKRPTASASGSMAIPRPTKTWHKDRNTPFKQYVRNYVSLKSVRGRMGQTDADGEIMIPEEPKVDILKWSL